MDRFVLKYFHVLFEIFSLLLVVIVCFLFEIKWANSTFYDKQLSNHMFLTSRQNNSGKTEKILFSQTTCLLNDSFTSIWAGITFIGLNDPICSKFKTKRPNSSDELFFKCSAAFFIPLNGVVCMRYFKVLINNNSILRNWTSINKLLSHSKIC